MKVIINGREVGGIEKYVWAIAGVLLMLLGIMLFVFVGLPMLFIGMGLVAALLVIAFIYRLVVGKWPSWFIFTYQ